MGELIAQALVFIGAAVLLVPIFQRLGFGSVLGYLVAGIIVGPFGLKLIHDAESIAHVSELGVVLLLFMIGLEIQPRKLWAMRRHLVGLGGSQVAICTLIFTGVAWKLGGLPLASAAVIGFGLSLSSTAFAVQTLVERGQFNTEYGRNSFAILLTQDLLAIPALAIIPALGFSNTLKSESTNASLAIGIIAGLVLTSRYMIRPVFRLIANTRSREIFTAATLFIVLGVAALMQQVGLSAALGTFIAGVLLADSEYRHELETDLEPFKSLLMGLFFIAVGMGVNLNVVIQQPLTVVLLAVGYLLVKSLVIYGVGRTFKMDHLNSKQMALAISQGGEFAFVIFGIAVQLGVAPNEMLALLTAVVTLSMALNPVISMVTEYMSCRETSQPKYDEIKGESPEVIIAGFGRFGQIFGRILRAQEKQFVAIDHDPNQIELVRRFGSKVYYGDASREDLLEMAGARQAKYFILAIDDVEVSLKTAKTVLEKFPHLKIFARARNRSHVYDLMEMGVKNIKREVLDSSIQFVGELLVEMGYPRTTASVMIEKFKNHDEIMLLEQFKVRADDKSLMNVSARSTALLAQVLKDDTEQSRISSPSV